MVTLRPVPNLRGVALAVALLLAGCTPITESPTPSDHSAGSPSPVAGSGDALTAAREDLDFLVAQLEGIHPEPWHGVTREDFLAEVDAIKADLPTMTPDQAMVSVMHLVARISAEGRDGHMFSMPADRNAGHALPLRVYEFDDGVFVTDAAPPHEGIVGREITAIGEHPIQEVLDTLEPLVPRDGPATVPAFRTLYFLRVEVLRGLGLIGEGPIAVTVTDGTVEETVDLEPMPLPEYEAWAGPGGMLALPVRDVMWLSRPTDIFYLEYLPDSRTLYARYRQVQTFPAALAAELEDRADDPDVDRVVLDLRENGGGDNHTYPTLLEAVRSEAVDQPGRLFLLTDRLTFSAASNFSTEVEQTTSAIFAGEPMGGGLNFWDDVTQVELDHLPVPMTIGGQRPVLGEVDPR
jgi:hypothetical protein